MRRSWPRGVLSLLEVNVSSRLLAPIARPCHYALGEPVAKRAKANPSTAQPPSQCVARDSKICGGKPVIAGTRTPTKLVYDFFIAGTKARQLARDYGVSVAAIEAAVAFEKDEARRKAAAHA